MTNDKHEILHRCVVGAFAGTLTFRDVLQHMSSVGVRWFSANLHFGIKTHYFENGDVHQEKWPEWTPQDNCPKFNKEAVIAAVQATRAGQIIYPEFLRQIAGAGVAIYTVHLQGGKTIYLGADGDFYVEPFPQ